MIPLFIDCTGRRVVIFGGGAVSARKAAYFTGEAEVTVVSRSFGPGFSGLHVRKVEMECSSATDAELRDIIRGSFLAIAATSDAGVNDRIGAICRSLHILFNNADGTPGDVILPAVSRGERYAIAISTFGSSPAVARFLRERIEEEYPALDAMIGLQESLRSRLRTGEPATGPRARILADVLRDSEVWAALGSSEASALELAERRHLHG
jgi:precorrin-2 dehydrogenase/sirohydrochlorin ferrochelatase